VVFVVPYVTALELAPFEVGQVKASYEWRHALLLIILLQCSIFMVTRNGCCGPHCSGEELNVRAAMQRSVADVRKGEGEMLVRETRAWNHLFGYSDEKELGNDRVVTTSFAPSVATWSLRGREWR